jgi:hypothetical protein
VVVASPVKGVLAKNNSDNLIAQRHGTPLFLLNSPIPVGQAVAADAVVGSEK